MNLSRATYQKYFAFDVNGHPLNGGRVSTYVDGTDTPAATYKNREGTILNPNPIVLDARGEAEIWLDTAVTYKFIVTDRHGRKVGQYDHVTSNTRTFEAQGSSTITTEESTVDGKTIVTFKVKDGSIGFEELKDARHTIPDSHYLQFKRLEMNGSECIVVTLCEGLKSWLATQGYTYDE